MSQSIQRAVEVLEFLSTAPRTQSEVAMHLDTHRSTALRILQTLTDSGLTRRNPDGSYSIGYRFVGLAHVAEEQFDLPIVARPRMQELGHACGHTIHLAALEPTRIVYAYKVEPAGMVRLHSKIGQIVQLHTAGVAKAILAYQEAARVDDLFVGYRFERFTETTRTSREEYDRDLDAVRETGYAVDDGEHEDFVNCIATPIRDASGAVVAACSITALKAKAPLPTLKDMLPDLLHVTDGISRDLGWRA
ncbi:IclR family transcriptional regulator [Microbacterium sp. NIBRBAC000506063]|uniref:IclR family transcriptional regulator n=1 Tax=Microbacterium sp. NIBRBAC000506063 TaxID=2734618 RepID=UPI001BB5CA28|nr:IclR family transcriptional regulator [Microbacterium sp. NIBRBAC000506063]QTV80294.1 IclR family transcriptional regulator [Microbacterium sp. NIBRBAC000506063]